MAADPTIFLIGATGFVGGYLTELLAQKYPSFHLICLLRNATTDRITALKALNPNISIVKGTLEDREIIIQTAKTVDIVIHVAHSDHWPSVSAVLEGLKENAKVNVGNPPIYIHMSGCGIIADNVRGEKVEYTKEWTDLDLDLNDCPPENTHLESDRAILEAGTRSDAPIRSIILFPCLIYGLGKTQRSGMWIPIFSDLAKKAGHAGTWGPGEVTQYAIHVKDVASAVVCVLEAALEGRVKGGKDGLFFVTTKEPTMSWKEITSVMGDIMHVRGMVKEPGQKPFPPEITEPLGNYGWSLLGSNSHARADKLKALGWKPVNTRKEALKDMLPAMIMRGI